MARPTHIPVCRLHIPLGVNQSTAWRRAQRGDFGTVTRDNDGRQQIEVAQVEQVEGVTFDNDLLCAMAEPRTFKRSGPRLTPMRVQIPQNAASLTRDEIKTLIDAHLLVRDGQWRRYLARVEELTAETLEGQAIFAGVKP